MYFQNNLAFDSCDFSDAFSDADSVETWIDSLTNSPMQTLNDEWCDSINNIETEFNDFDNSIADLFSNPHNLNFTNQQQQQQQQQQIHSPQQYGNSSPLQLPMQYGGSSPNIHQQQQPQPQLQQPQQQASFQIQQINQPMYPTSSQHTVCNNSFNTYVDSYPTSPHSLMDSLAQQSNNSGNPLNNGSFDDLYQIRMEIFNNANFQSTQQLLQNNNSNAEVFRLNQSNISQSIDRSQKFLMDLMKQQHQDLVSNQSSPPPTPSSDWADIPSPCSPIKQVKTEFIEKDLSIIQRHESGVGGEIKIPSSLKINDIKKELQQNKTAKRKRNSRKQYSVNSGKPRLYKFLREILEDPSAYPCIEWVDKTTGTFKFLDSSEVARLWGHRKNKPSMKYENFARSLRTYIAKGILKKPRNKLVYCFAHPENE